MEKIASSCPYCGVGCRLIYVTENNQVTKIEGDKTDPISLGTPCIKGLTCHEPFRLDRLEFPQIRKDKENNFTKVSWEEAFNFIKEKISNFRGEEIGLMGSGEFANEDNFILSKFARLVLGTANIDCCARLCHAATTVSMRKLFGNTAMPNLIEDLERADVILAIATNPAGNYPVAFNRIRKAKRSGAKLIAIDIAKSGTGKEADVFIKLNYKGITAFAAGLAKLLIDDEVYEKNCEDHEGFKEFKESLQSFNLERVIEMTQVSKDQFLGVYDFVKNAKNLCLMHGMGATQHQDGVENIISILSLAQLKNAMIIPMRGKINVQGAGDMGTCPDWLPFGGSPSKTNEVWGELSIDTPGHRMTDFVFSDKTKAFIIMGDSPAQSLPELDTVHKKLKTSFVICLHHHPTKTTEFADVILPVTLLGETEGTITNAERRVRPLRQVLAPIGEAKPSWQVLSELAGVFGKSEYFQYDKASEIFEEITKATPAYAELFWDKIFTSDDNFGDKEKSFEKFIPIKDTIPEVNDPGFPWLLTTERSPFHFCVAEGTLRSSQLKKLMPKALLYINSSDAKKLNLTDGERVRVTSRSGELEIDIKINDDCSEGIVSSQFHFSDTLINKLFSRSHDYLSGTPNLKTAWVKIEKI